VITRYAFITLVLTLSLANNLNSSILNAHRILYESESTSRVTAVILINTTSNMSYPANSSVSGPGREGRGEFHGPSSELPVWLIGNQPQIIAEQQEMIARLTRERNSVQKSARQRHRQTMVVRQQASAIADKYESVVKDNRTKEMQINDLKKELTKANETNTHLAADNAQKDKKLSEIHDLLAGVGRLKLTQDLKELLSQDHNVGVSSHNLTVTSQKLSRLTHIPGGQRRDQAHCRRWDLGIVRKASLRRHECHRPSSARVDRRSFYLHLNSSPDGSNRPRRRFSARAAQPPEEAEEGVHVGVSCGNLTRRYSSDKQ
jgi:hypothetical protein